MAYNDFFIQKNNQKIRQTSTPSGVADLLYCIATPDVTGAT